MNNIIKFDPHKQRLKQLVKETMKQTRKPCDCSRCNTDLPVEHVFYTKPEYAKQWIVGQTIVITQQPFGDNKYLVHSMEVADEGNIRTILKLKKEKS
jgi:hypothetical protein